MPNLIPVIIEKHKRSKLDNVEKSKYITIFELFYSHFKKL